MSDKTSGLVLSGEPRAQLLPPSVREHEKSRAARRMMGLVLVLAVVLAGGGVAWAFLTQAAAQSALAESEQRTNALLAEQATYAEAARLANLVASTEQAQRTVTSSEVSWASLWNELATYVPEGTQIVGIDFLTSTPWEGQLATEGPLRVPRVATVALSFRSESYGAVAPFVERVPALYGFADVSMDSATFEDGAYTTVVTLALDTEALSGRFAVAAPSDDSEGSDG